VWAEAAIREAGLPTDRTGLIVWTESLSGKEIERRVPGRATPKNMAATPVLNCLCAQDYLEPVLRRFAERQGWPAALRHRGAACEQDEGGVTATLADRPSGGEMLCAPGTSSLPTAPRARSAASWACA
jgi:hypothetical protein